MNSALSLLLAIGDVDNRHLTCIDKKPRSLPRWKQVLVAACALLIFVCTAFFIIQYSSTATPPIEDGFISGQMPAPKNISIDILIDTADVIIRGTVTAEHRIQGITPQTPFVSSNVLMNDLRLSSTYEHTVTVVVDEVLKGTVSVQEALTVSNEAHDAYDKNGNFLETVYIGDAALMKSGDEMLLFLETSFSDSYDYRLIGECGKWFLGSDGQYRCGVLFDTRFPHSFTPRIGLDDYTPISKEEIKKWVLK